jgi:hypothetical protein
MVIDLEKVADINDTDAKAAIDDGFSFFRYHCDDLGGKCVKTTSCSYDPCPDVSKREYANIAGDVWLPDLTAEEKKETKAALIHLKALIPTVVTKPKFKRP